MRHRVVFHLSLAVAFLLVTTLAFTQSATSYAGVGCFKDRRPSSKRAMTFLATYRQPPNITMDWYDLENTVVKKCAEEAAKISSQADKTFLGIQFYGECWGGAGQYDRWGKCTNCEEIGGVFVGRHRTNFVYMLTGKECSDYKVLNDFTRARTYEGNTNRCDSFSSGWTKGWYRFEGAAGQKMADTCVPSGRCGTLQSGYFPRQLPAVEDGIVNGKVCFSRGSACCSSSVEIRVRNCGKFYVYDLPNSTNGCPKAYCGNGV